jgi:hypothetical protein
VNAFWTVAKTKPNCEKIAIENLRRQEFVYYQPLIREPKIRQGRRVMADVPLFPSYLEVTVTSGVFSGQRALVERMPAKDRQKVLLALLANKIHVLVDETELEAA